MLFGRFVKVIFVVGYLATSRRVEVGKRHSMRFLDRWSYKELERFRSQMEAYYLRVCVSVFSNLIRRAREKVVKVVEIDDRLKMADYIQLIPAYTYWGLNLQTRRF